MILVTGLILVIIAILLDSWKTEDELFPLCSWLARIGVVCIIVSLTMFLWRTFP